jgi:hypothetical protein
MRSPTSLHEIRVYIQKKILIRTSAGAELRLANGVVLLAKFDGEFASHSSTYAGTGTVRYPSPLSIKNSVIQ